MGDDQGRPAEIMQQPFQPYNAIDIEMIGGLIEQQQIRLTGERLRQRHTLDAAP